MKTAFWQNSGWNGRFFGTLAAHYFTKRMIASCLPTLYAVAQKTGKNLSEALTAIKGRFVWEFNLRREKPIYVRKTS